MGITLSLRMYTDGSVCRFTFTSGIYICPYLSMIVFKYLQQFRTLIFKEGRAHSADCNLSSLIDTSYSCLLVKFAISPFFFSVAVKIKSFFFSNVDFK